MSFPRYPAYKDSGVEWLGEVPKGWSLSKVGFLCEHIGSGKTPRGGSEVYTDDGVLFLRSQNVYDNGLRLDDVVYIDEKTDAEMSASRVQPGDVLLNITGASLGRTSITPCAFPRANVNQHVCILRCKETGFNIVLSLFLKSFAAKVQIELAQTGAAREGLNYSQIAQITIPIPPAEDRQAIATFLDRETAKIDALVANYQALIELLQEKRQALISHAVTKGLDPTVPMKDSGVEWLGEVPEHWDVVRLAEILREANDTGDEDLPILTVSIHHGVSDKEYDESELERKVSRSDDRSKYKTVRPGDLVYNMMRAWQGGFGAVIVDGLVSPAYVVARPIRQINTSFVEQVLRCPTAVEEMRRRSHGVTDFRLRLYWQEFKDIRIAIPPLEEQTKTMRLVERQTEKFDHLVTDAQEAITLLQERRTALISAAVTGKIDVRGLVATEEA